jgi:multisubunit Na+/H+ antiporter MnhB subunit
MLSGILIAGVLVAVTVAVHAAGVTVLLRALRRRIAIPPTHFWPITGLLVAMIWFLLLLHVAEILLWGSFYLWWECLPDAEAAFYFSGVTYTSIGYGDLVLATPWRLLAPIEGLTGILMCGLSTGLFFALVSHIHQARHTPTSGAAELTDGGRNMERRGRKDE